ncbi:MAG: YdhR family protein [Actinobacteria bacterium]|jgi:hypothetical protein|nr:YdhR family protein [Actinomycetota bacterium]
MILAMVEFPVDGASADEIDAIFEKSADRYRSVEGLIRKYYIRSTDNTMGGGMYLFTDQQSADKLYDDEWHRSFVERYGRQPQIKFFHCPIVVDNKIGEIVK